MSYQDKYLKYKNKYLELKNNSTQIGGAVLGGNIDNDLIEACKTQNLAEVNRLIALGANLEARDRTGTPLYHAIRRRNVAIVNRLIAAGANVNAVDFDDNSVLYSAASEGNLEIVVALLEANALPNINGFSNLTPLIAAASNSYLGEDPAQNLAIFNRLVAYGALINAADSAGDSVLIYAASSDNLPVVIRLIELGVNINYRNNRGSSAIMQTRSLEIVNRLIAAGANLTFVNNYGRNVLDINYENEELDLVKRLLEAGARPGPVLLEYQYTNAPGYERASDHRPEADDGAGAGAAGGGGGELAHAGLVPAGGYNRAALKAALTKKGDIPVPEILKEEKDMSKEDKVMDQYLKGTKCGVCLTNMKYVTICSLGHQICGACTIDIINRNIDKCPQCRNHINESNFKIVNNKYLKY